MSAWLAIGLVVVGLVAVALAILAADIGRGDVGGARHTIERARRLLVVATDERTRNGAERWIREQRSEHPDLQFFVLSDAEGQELYMAIQEAIERDRPDAIVVARHAEGSHSALAGVYGRLKEDLSVPVDAIYVPEEKPR
ncbi:MAG: hypothetical protein M3537_00325 [Chloroflexota bacterium]|nr:hypothetical protein [Chloroflexota bacterium]